MEIHSKIYQNVHKKINANYLQLTQNDQKKMLTNYSKNVNIFIKHFNLVRTWEKIQVHMLQLYGVEFKKKTIAMEFKLINVHFHSTWTYNKK